MSKNWKTGSALGAMAIAMMMQAAQAAPAPQEAAPKKAKTRITTRAQDRDPSDETTEEKAPVTAGSKVTDDGNASDIVVIGIRGAIDSAIARKRDSAQIVDSVVAEDAGKLPDNNVPEAISRIPGVNIVRSQGQGGQVTIRGLAGVQTTVNGQGVEVGDGRALNLSDIPAELIKSVDVYKSRSASQPEGGIGGTVNVELRRPLELKKGLLVAGSIRGLYNDLVDGVTPFASLLLSYRFDTGIGEMGLLVNGSFTRTRYAEALVQSESPDELFGAAQESLPAAVRATAVAPYRIQYGLNSGERDQPAVTATWQWRPSDKLNFVLEGQYLGATFHDRYSGLSLQTREGYPTLSNVVIGKSGAITSATYTNPNPTRDAAGNVVFGVPVNVFGGDGNGRNSTVIGNFETHWASGIARIDFSTQYQHYVSNNYRVNFGQGFPGATSAVVDFNSNAVPGGAPNFTLPGVNLADPTQSVLTNIGDALNRNTTDTFVSQLDTSLDFGNERFLRAFRFGARYTTRDDKVQYGYRNVRWDDPATRPRLAALGAPTITISPDIAGQRPVTYVSYDPAYIYDNFDALKAKILTLGSNGFDGNGPQTSVTDFLAPGAPTLDRLQGGRFRENTFAFYGELGWGFDMGFPVDGQVGLRYVNFWGDTKGAQLIIPENPDGTCCGVGFVQDSAARGNSADLLPTVSAAWHFFNNLQLRTTYNYNVQRPSFYAIRDTYIIPNPSNPNADVYAGNPGLKPIRDKNFNASLEWFPRPGTSLTAGAFYKKQTGFIYYTQRLEPVPVLGGAIRRVFRERNAGPGEVLGFEFAGNLPFFFLPDGLLRNFGVNANLTYIPHAILSVPDETGGNFIDKRSPFTSEVTTNVVLFYETPRLSGRLAYNWRSQFKTGFDAINPGWVQIGLPQDRLDAAINYTPVRFLTLSLEGTNLTQSIDRYRYDLYPDLSVGLRSMARTVQASARFRF